MIFVTLSTIGLLLLVVLPWAFRRRRGRRDPFELGAVSQQWLLVHKGEDR
jgi:hypothetical protein